MHNENLMAAAATLIIALLIFPPIYAIAFNNPALWVFWLAYVCLIVIAVVGGRRNGV